MGQLGDMTTTPSLRVPRHTRSEASASHAAGPAAPSSSAALDTTAVIATPERVAFSFELAGPVRRTLAYGIDAALRAVVLMILTVAAALGEALGSGGFEGIGTGVMLTFAFVMEWGYFVALEMLMGGQSIGKRALGLRVVSEDGRPLGFAASVLRNLVRAADFLPLLYALGIAVMLKDKSFRRLGDMAAGTLVIVEGRRKLLGPLVISPPPSPQELAWLPHKVDLSTDDLDAIELFLRRLNHYPAAREIELAEQVAPIYAARMGLSYHHPVRFLALLHYRATHRSDDANPR